MSKVILYISMSLDGYIAKPDDDLSFLSIVEKEGEDYGFLRFISTVETIIIGRKTYDWILNATHEFPYKDKITYVITNTPKPSVENIHFHTEGLSSLINKLKQENKRNIYCDGGAQIVNQLLQEDLLDEMIISIIPILIGNGTKLFQEGIPEQKLKLINASTYDTGLIQLHYKKQSEKS
ncbi:dihydrofolate reductase family protein [Neisseria shayeganii]|uniref:Dihydrofolate reductase n=1 Tax=Neisseria shayeganii 871 TaxID=1032488 RepID=G4CHA8_9NEIS|nr:dihydrofolate reductase family protein [Neisseria shayeganii]EGY52818.1 dihydrofolate reductase [Neisseria shayeganii 871]